MGSVDTFSQTVMPSLHSSGWQRKHLDWEFKLANKESEPDEALVEGIINATESFLRSSEVHRLLRRGLPCLSLIQLPKKRTNVDPKKHNKIQRLYVCGEEVNASGKRYRPVEMETDSGYHQHEQPQLRPLDHNQYSHEHYQQQQYRTYGNS